jgi:dynein heavy chain
VFGLHKNAEISSAIIETDFICETVLTLLPRDVGGGGASTDDIIKTKIKEILSKLPKPFDTDHASKKHPVLYEESMNTVLQQELFRFNKLLKTVSSTLINVDKAIDGFVTMSHDLELVFNSVFDNRVPDAWNKVSYPSLKPLGSWVNDFVERLKFMQKWIDEGAPPNFWISGFFFTQSFLTGVLQNFARKYKTPIDTLAFEFTVFHAENKGYDISQAPKDGCFVHGLFLDGARWDDDLSCLNESYSKVLYSKVPYIWLLPTDKKIETPEDKVQDVLS